jgi:hypothetical protein
MSRKATILAILTVSLIQRWDIVTLSEETERNREYKHQPVATTPVFYTTI